MSRVWTWRQAIWESELAATTKIILQALASHLNDMGDAMFPSQARLARMCSLSERAVIAHLQIAEQAGWLTSRTRELRGAKWASKEYVAAWPEGVNDVHPRGEPRSGGGVNDVHTNSPSELSIEHTTRVRRFNEFWELYPDKQARKLCEGIWTRRKLDDVAEQVIAGLRRWLSSDRWKRGVVMNPSTFLNQERWQDAPPAGEAAPLLKGEVRVRETTDAEKAQARFNHAVMSLRKLPENIRKSDSEIAQLARDALYEIETLEALNGQR